MDIYKTLIANALKFKFNAYSATGSLGSTNLLEGFVATSFNIDGVTYEQIDITAITSPEMYKQFSGGVGDSGKVTMDGILFDGQAPPAPPLPLNAVVMSPQGRLTVMKPDGTTEIFSCDANLSETGSCSAQGKTTLLTGIGFQLCGAPKWFGAGVGG